MRPRRNGPWWSLIAAQSLRPCSSLPTIPTVSLGWSQSSRGSRSLPATNIGPLRPSEGPSRSTRRLGGRWVTANGVGTSALWPLSCCAGGARSGSIVVWTGTATRRLSDHARLGVRLLGMGAGCQSGFDLRDDDRGGGRAAPDESEERPEVARRDEPGEEQAWDARLEACVQDGTAVDRLEIASQMGAS